MKAEDLKPIIEKLLNIDKIRVEEVEIDETGDVIIKVESTVEGTSCRKCGREIKQQNGRDDAIRLRHLPMLGHKVYIEIRPKRYLCPTCSDKPTTTQRLEWYTPRSPHTKAYEKYLMRQLVNSTIEDVSIKEQIGYKAIEAVLDRSIGSQVNWDDYQDLTILGLDEIALKKGHKDFVTIVSRKASDEEVQVITVLAGRKKETVQRFLNTIPDQLKGTVQRVCCDLYDGFINAVKAVLPQAKVVADRYHVAKLYRDGADQLRKKELKRIKKYLPKPEQDEIKGTLWAFRKNRKDLKKDEKQLLNRLFQQAPKLKLAYQLREKLTSIFEQKLTKEQATHKIKNWKKRVLASGLTCFDSFVTTLDNWMDEITNYFIDRDNSGFVEGLNNKIKVLKRRCYGLFNLSHLFKRLVLDLEGYELFAS
jgi:transposase